MKMTRIVALVMALVMLCSMPAMAEAKLCALTVNNISIQQNADAASKFGVELRLSGGGEDGQAYVGIAAAGNGTPIVNAEFAMQDDDIIMAMDGLTSNYAISKGDIEKLMEQSQSGDMPFDPKDVQELVESYIAALKQAAEMGKQTMSDEELAAYYADAGFAAVGEETVTVNGIEMTLPRYDLDLDAQGLDQMVQASLDRLPAMKDCLQKYVAFVNKVAAGSGETIALDPEHMFSAMFGQTNIDMRVKAALWTDAKGENMRMEMVETVSVILPEPKLAEGDVLFDDAPGEPLTVPITMQVNTDERGQHMTMDMEMEQYGTRVAMNFKMNDAMLTEGAKADFDFSMIAMDEAFSMTGDYDYAADGAGAANCEMRVPTGDSAESRISVRVNSTGGDVNTNSVQLRYTQMQKSGAVMKELSRLTIGFDVTVQKGALPQGALIDNGKPTVDIPSMTEEQQQAAVQELMTKGIQAYGQLMATDGVAKLMTDLIMVATQAFQTYSESVNVAA